MFAGLGGYRYPSGEFRGIPWGGTVTDAIMKFEAAGLGTEGVLRNRSKELKPFFGVPVANEIYNVTTGAKTPERRE